MKHTKDMTKRSDGNVSKKNINFYQTSKIIPFHGHGMIIRLIGIANTVGNIFDTITTYIKSLQIQQI